jgi:hypothetical protein
MDRKLQRGIVIGLKDRILEAQRSLFGAAQQFPAGRNAADVVRLPREGMRWGGFLKEEGSPMKAAVLKAFGSPLTIETVPEPDRDPTMIARRSIYVLSRKCLAISSRFATQTRSPSRESSARMDRTAANRAGLPQIRR